MCIALTSCVILVRGFLSTRVVVRNSPYNSVQPSFPIVLSWFFAERHFHKAKKCLDEENVREMQRAASKMVSAYRTYQNNTEKRKFTISKLSFWHN